MSTTHSSGRRKAVWFLGFATLIWAVELWFLQEQTLLSSFKPPEMLRTRQLFRFGFDVALLAALVFYLPRRVLYGVLAAVAAVCVLGGVYFDYYGRLPRLSAAAQAGEGAAIFPLIVGMIKPGRAFALLGLFAIKCGLIHVAGKSREAVPTRVKRAVAIAAAGVYSVLFLVANLTFDPMSNMKKWGNAGRFGMTYGFLIPMMVEAHYAGSDSFLERALESAAQSRDRLTPLEADVALFDRVVFLQVESLDWGVIDHRTDGREVTPNLNRLKRTSMFYKAEAAHFTGSADADFVALMGVWPSRDIVTYKIRNYPFGSAVAHELRRRGYRTTSIHGVTGDFFERREAFEKMGIERLVFQEELKASGVPALHDRYEWIQDAELLDYAARELSRESGKAFHLVITVTSHSPFKELPPAERAKCPRFSEPADRYFCSMEYVDRAIGRYLERIPAGTTLVVYGDHNSSIGGPDYESGRRGDRDWVPVFVHNHPGDLAVVQKTRNLPISTDGTLTFVEVVKYVHRQMLNRPASTVAASAERHVH